MSGLATKTQFLDVPIKIFLLYRKHSWRVASFIDGLAQSLYDNIDIIMGDFNINAFDCNENLEFTSTKYELAIRSATLLVSGQCDNIYIKKFLLDQVHVESIIHTIHFSDQDAVKLKLITTKNRHLRLTTRNLEIFLLNLEGLSMRGGGVIIG